MALAVSSTSQTTTAAISSGLPSRSFTLASAVSRFLIRVDTLRLRANGFTHCRPAERMVPRYRPNSWITRASPAMTGVRPWKPSSAAMSSRTPTTTRIILAGPWTRPLVISSATATSTAATLATRTRTPDTDRASYSVICGAGRDWPAIAGACVFMCLLVLADLMFSFPPEEAPGNEGKDQRVAGQHQQRLCGRELALHRVLDRFHRRTERGEVADALEDARHELPRIPHAGEEQQRVEGTGPDGAGGGPAPGRRRHGQPDGEERGDRQHDRQHQRAGVFRCAEPEGCDAHDHEDEQ